MLKLDTIQQTDRGIYLFQDTRVSGLNFDFTYIWAIQLLGIQCDPPPQENSSKYVSDCRGEEQYLANQCYSVLKGIPV